MNAHTHAPTNAHTQLSIYFPPVSPPSITNDLHASFLAVIKLHSSHFLCRGDGKKKKSITLCCALWLLSTGMRLLVCLWTFNSTTFGHRCSSKMDRWMKNKFNLVSHSSKSNSASLCQKRKKKKKQNRSLFWTLISASCHKWEELILTGSGTASCHHTSAYLWPVSSW